MYRAPELHDNTDLIATLRRELRRELRFVTARSLAVLPLSFALWCVTPHYAESLAKAHALPLVATLYASASVLLVAYLLLVRAPRLRRQLTELGS